MTQRRQTTKEASSQAAITPMFVLQALGRWWMIALPLALVMAIGAGAVVYLTFTPEYHAAVMVKIDSKRPYVVFRTQEVTKQFIDNQVEMIKSDLVLMAVVSKPEIARLPELREENDKIKQLRKRIQVQQIGKSELFRIGYKSPDPDAAAMVANEVSKQYFSLRNNEMARRTQRVVDLLRDAEQAHEAQVIGLRDSVRNLAQKSGVADPFASDEHGKNALTQHPLSAIAMRIDNTKVNREILQAKIQAIKEANKAPIEVPAAIVDRSLDELDIVRDLKARIAATKLQLQDYELRGKNPKTSPYYKQRQRQVESHAKQLKEVLELQRPKLIEELQSVEAGRRAAELQKLETELASETVAEAALQKQYDSQYDSQKDSVATSAGNSADLELKLLDFARANRVLEMIETRSLEISTERAAPEQVTKLLDASAPSTPVEKIPLKRLAMAVLASMCIPFGLAMAWEWHVRRISDAQQLEDSQIAVVGEISNLPTRARRGSIKGRVARDLSLFEESIDSLWTSLDLANQHKGMQVLAVTSACTREGKTSLSTQLAVSIARATHQKTLLIDGDMRAPDVHNVFDIPLDPGLAEVLEGEVELEDAIVTGWSDDLHFLPGGRLKSNPHSLIGNSSLDAVLAEARKHYTYIVLDTPPVLAAGEALVLAKSADVSVLCAMRNRSRIKQVQAVYNRLAAANVNPVGVVLNGVPAQRYAYSYGYYDYTRA